MITLNRIYDILKNKNINIVTNIDVQSDIERIVEQELQEYNGVLKETFLKLLKM